MTKYDELTKLVQAQTEAAIIRKVECKDVARQVVKGFREYIGCPEGAIAWMKLNADLEPTGEATTLELTAGKDGFWYFGFAITFRSVPNNGIVEVTLVWGVKMGSDASFTVRMAEEAVIDASKDEELANIYDRQYQIMKEDFARTEGDPIRHFGFRSH